MIGKVPPELLGELVVDRTGASDERVRQGPAYGEDAAAIDLGERTLVVSTDPISLAVERIGTLGVDVACNDVAAAGADPAWMTAALFLPDDDEAVLDAITRQLDEAADRAGVSIVGGHSEYAPALETPMVVLTCLGLADRFVPTSGAEPGDRIVLTGGAGIEGTAILATDFRADLEEEVPADVLDSAGTFYDEVGVREAAAVLREHATAMHDPTEGGLLAGLVELASASGVALDVDPDAIPVREETAAVCAAAGVDPLRIFGSGALVATVPADAAESAVGSLRERGITAAVVGEVAATKDPEVRLGDQRHRDPVRDDMYDLWA